MASILKVDWVATEKPDIGLVDKGGWLKDVPLAFPGKVRVGELAKLFINDGKQLLEFSTVPKSDFLQQPRDFARRVAARDLHWKWYLDSLAEPGLPVGVEPMAWRTDERSGHRYRKALIGNMSRQTVLIDSMNRPVCALRFGILSGGAICEGIMLSTAVGQPFAIAIVIEPCEAVD